MSKLPPPVRTVLVVVVAVTALLATTGCEPLPPTPPGGTAADCRDVRWGSGAKTFDRMTTAPITGVRVGRNRCFDRMVIDLRSAPAPGWVVRYVTQVSSPGSGFVVPLRGGAKLEVIARAPAYADSGATYSPANPAEAANVGGFRTFRQVAFAGSFEGQSHVGLGVRARLPFRVFAIEDGGRSRLVVDVAHVWP